MSRPKHARVVAKENGDPRFFTGQPCKHGHVSERLTSNGACVECHRARYDPTSFAWRKENKEHLQTYMRLWKYGISPEQFEDQWMAQDGKCGICSDPLVKRSVDGKKKGVAHVDHDHETGAWRGLLCGPCNFALAYIEDEGFVKAARAYLATHPPHQEDYDSRLVRLDLVRKGKSRKSA